MFNYSMKRIAMGILTLIIVSVIVYFLVVSIKGNPIDKSQVGFGKGADKRYEARLEYYGINKPSYVRFWLYVKGIFHGSWGDVYSSNAIYKTVPEFIFKPIKYTMMVMVPAYIFGMVIGIFVGFVAGYKRGTTTDTIIVTFAVIFIAVPSFLIASYALLLAPKMHLPSIFQDNRIIGVTTGQMIKSLIIPIFVITLTSIAGWTYYIRNEVSSILKSDHVTAVRSRGFSGPEIFRKYVFRNAIYPIAGSMASSFMVIFSSSLIIERVFNIPGTSQQLTYAVKNGEINILMFQVIFFGAINIFLEIFADIVRFLVDPRIRTSFKASITPYKYMQLKHTRYTNDRKKVRKD